MYSGYYESPIGLIKVEANEQAVTLVDFVEEKEQTCENEIVKRTLEQLNEYFKGERKSFDVPLFFKGTPFQEKVWTELQNIPYGVTSSYKELAIKIGNEKAVRAVGSTNGKNKISIIIPCHRVIGASGKLVGYAGGLNRKEWLLHHEQQYLQIK
ncbi:MAG: methylated-DNA--[protein]-cysteine S-methyltransferase [Bacillaceae bacterium]